MRSHGLTLIARAAVTLLITAGCTSRPPESPANDEEPILGPPPAFAPLPIPPEPEKPPSPLPIPQAQPPKAQPPEDPSPPQFKIIFFDEDSANIPPRDRPSIDYNVAVLHRHPRLGVLIEGHCNEHGSESYNLELGWRRAEAVARAFESAGIARSRLETVSTGKDGPLELGHTADAWATNRASVVRER